MNRLTVQKQVQDAVIKELKEKHIEEILVNEITDKANVARSSFYRYYHSIRDVVLDYFLSLINEEVKIDDTLIYQNIKDNTESLFSLVYKYSSVFEVLVRDNLYDILFKSISSFAIYHAERLGIKDQKFIISSYSGAMSALIIEWFNNGKKESVEELVDIFARVSNLKEIKD